MVVSWCKESHHSMTVWLCWGCWSMWECTPCCVRQRAYEACWSWLDWHVLLSIVTSPQHTNRFSYKIYPPAYFPPVELSWRRLAFINTAQVIFYYDIDSRPPPRCCCSADMCLSCTTRICSVPCTVDGVYTIPAWPEAGGGWPLYAGPPTDHN